jgi:superfamily II DNA or RNA helicase
MSAIAKLRPYQAQAIEDTRKLMKANIKRVMIYAPTGAGKSVISAAIIESAAKRGKRVAWVVNRIELCNQAAEHLHAAGVDCGIMQGENSRATYMPVIVCSIQTLASRGIPEGVELFIVDEAHFCAASKEFLALAGKYPGTPMIGFSATPFTRGLSKVHAFGPMFGAIVIAATIPALIEQGFLVDADVYAPGGPDLSKVKTVAGDYHEGQLAEAVDKPELIGDIVAHWFKLADGKRTLCFATNIAHSKHIVDEFTRAGVRAMHIDAYTPDKARRTIIDGFKAGEFEVLSNCAILAEGFDCPAAEVMILARPTKSLVRHIQMAGRILRPFEGKAKATILDHSGTTQRLGFVTDDLPIELDDGKPRKGSEPKPKPEALPKLCSNCKFLKPAKVHKCPACGFAPQRQSDVEVGEGELVLLKRSKHQEQRHQVRKGLAEFGSKQDVYGQLLKIQRDKGYTKGWVGHKYRTIFGVWPVGLDDYPQPPSERMTQFLRAEAIRYSYAKNKKDKHDAAAA